MRQHQRTLGHEVTLGGVGLFTGAQALVALKPAPPDHGLVLVRTDLADWRAREISVHVRNVTYRLRRTALRCGPAGVETCEHVLSALMAAGVDNARIEISGAEMPMGDGSADPFARAIEDAGVVDQDAARRTWRLAETVRVGDEHTWIEASPAAADELILSYELDYGEGAPIAPQVATFEVGTDTFRTELAPARTFVLDHELAILQSSGMCQHLSPLELLVIGAEGPLGGKHYRFPDEPARHKVLDILGDLALIGRPIRARIRAHRSGHALNHLLVRELLRSSGRPE